MLIKYPLVEFFLHWMTCVVTGLKKFSKNSARIPARGWEKRGLCVPPGLSECSSHLPGCREASWNILSIPDLPHLPSQHPAPPNPPPASARSFWRLPQQKHRLSGDRGGALNFQSIISERDEQALIATSRNLNTFFFLFFSWRPFQTLP